MPTIENDLVRVCLRLHRADYSKLKSVSKSSGNAGVNKLIRTIVHSYTNQLVDLERQRLDAVAIDIDLDDIKFDPKDFDEVEDEMVICEMPDEEELEEPEAANG